MITAVLTVTCITHALLFPRQTTLAVYLLSLVGMIVYAATLSLGHLWVVFITAGVLGYSFIVSSNILVFCCCFFTQVMSLKDFISTHLLL